MMILDKPILDDAMLTVLFIFFYLPYLQIVLILVSAVESSLHGMYFACFYPRNPLK